VLISRFAGLDWFWCWHWGLLAIPTILDPRDIFLGDFVRLDYELSWVDTSLATLSIPGKKWTKGLCIAEPHPR